MTYLAETTLYLSVTAAFILIFKRLFKNKLSAKWQVYIWALLLVRFLVPTLPQSEISVFNAVSFPGEYTYTLTETVPDEMPEAIPDLASPAVDTGEEGRNSLFTDESVLLLWSAGAISLFFYFLFVYYVCLYKTKKSSRIADEDTVSLLSACREMVGVKRGVSIISGGVSPMLIGFLRPVIVLPHGYTQSEKKDIIIHELCHLKNGDVFTIWVAILVLCFNWFNPVIWYSFFAFRRDIEVYCDERVLKYSENKKEYAALLLKTALSKNRFIAGTTSLQNGEKEVERRIKHIAYFKKPKTVWSIFIAVIAAIISAVCLTNSTANCFMTDEKFAHFTSREIGAVMADIAYADNEKVVFYYLNGMFVYNIKTMTLEKKLDLSKLDCALPQQGDTSLQIRVSKDGKTAMLVNYGNEKEIKKFDNYLVNLENGKAKKVSNTEIDAFPVAISIMPEGIGWISTSSVYVNNTHYYLKIDTAPLVRNVKIVQSDMSGNILKEYYPFGTQKELYKYKNTYIGDAPAVRAIVERANLTPYKVHSIELKTGETPYRIVVNMKVDDRAEHRSVNYSSLNQTAALILSLVKNADEVVFNLFDNYSDINKPDTSFSGSYMSRNFMYERRGMKKFTADYINHAADTKEAFNEYYNAVMAVFEPDTTSEFQNTVNEIIGKDCEVVVNSQIGAEFIVNKEFEASKECRQLGEILPVIFGKHSGVNMKIAKIDVRNFKNGEIRKLVLLYYENPERGIIVPGHKFLENEKEREFIKDFIVKRN